MSTLIIRSQFLSHLHCTWRWLFPPKRQTVTTCEAPTARASFKNQEKPKPPSSHLFLACFSAQPPLPLSLQPPPRMQQRPTGSFRATAENHSMITIVDAAAQQQQQLEDSPRSMDESCGRCLVYFRHPGPKRTDNDGEISQSRSNYSKWIHGIPFILMLCLSTLWWFSYPVNLVIKNGKIVTVHPFEEPLPLSSNRVELAILAAALSPMTPVLQNLTASDAAEAHPLSITD